MIQFAGFVEFLDVVLALQVVAVQFADEQPTALIPAYAGWFVD